MAEHIPLPPNPRDHFPDELVYEMEALSSHTDPRLIQLAAERLEHLRSFYEQTAEQQPPARLGRSRGVFIGLELGFLGSSLFNKDYFFAAFWAGLLAIDTSGFIRVENKWREATKPRPNTRYELIGGYMNRLNNNGSQPDQGQPA